MKIKSIYFLWLLYGKSHLNAHGFWCIEKDWFQYASACAWDITDYLSNLDRFTCNFPFHRSLYVECAKESVIFYYVGISGPLPRNPVSCMVYLYISSVYVFRDEKLQLRLSPRRGIIFYSWNDGNGSNNTYTTFYHSEFSLLRKFTLGSVIKWRWIQNRLFRK